MTLLDRVLPPRAPRSPRRSPENVRSDDRTPSPGIPSSGIPSPGTPSPGTSWWQAPVAGALAAVGSWLVLALPVLVVWVATDQTTVGWGQALGVASAGWFLGHGAGVSLDTVHLSLAPLGVFLAALAVTARGARRLLDRAERTASGTAFRELLVRRLVPGFVAGYAGSAVLALLLTLAGPARPDLLGVAVALRVPVLALAWVLLRRHDADEEAGVVGDWLDRLPTWLARVLWHGLLGSAWLLLLGTLVVAVMVVARWSTVSGLDAAVGAGLVGGVALTAAQLLLLPNLAVYALAWLAGPGFQIADGSSVTLTGAHPGLMPMIPVLGALPSDGTWSRWLLLLLGAPVAMGAVIGWQSCRALARLSSWRTRLVTASAAVTTSAVAVTVLALLGSGSLGVDRLRAVGPQPLLLGAVLLGDLLLGAGAYVAVTQLRLRLRPHG